MKNIIIGYGETLTESVKIKGGSGPKKHPYTLQEAQKRMENNLSEIIETISSKPGIECANEQVVVKFIQHPSYLAKSYYPKKLFNKFNLHDIGSRSVKISPDKWAIKKHPNEGLASCIFVSGTKDEYLELLRSVKEDQLGSGVLEQVRTIESIDIFNAQEKIKGLSIEGSNNKLEVALHASAAETSVVAEFYRYIEYLGGKAESSKLKCVGGLTFLPVSVQKGNETKLAEFSHLRVLRSMPKLRFNTPDTIRATLPHKFSLPTYEQLNNDFKVCIFDGGIGTQHLLDDWITEIIPQGVKSAHPSYLSHGSEVCSTYLFGPFQTATNTLGQPYTNVDIVRVLSPEDKDPDLFDVLNRIESVLKLNKYKYINLSLGPRIAIDDDDVNVWTSVLDSYFQSGSCLATVAIGNDGDLEGADARIQPPSDMVNSLAVGACNSNDENWERASYSCIGPGRSPGIVKPDGVMFGGSSSNLFPVYSPLLHKIIGTQGTSYSAPFALRVAAGIDAITDISLNPTTIKALMIHHTNSNGSDVKEVGWGKFPDTPEEVIECLDDEATIIFQGELETSQHLRIPIPVPEDCDCTWVHLKATFCINAITDPEHPLHYTRAGLDITFRSNDSKFESEENDHAKSKTFFSCKTLYPTENELREDAHKWETSVTRSQKFKKSSLVNPVFDVRHHGREQGASPSSPVEPIKYSLILTIKTQGDTTTYNKILQRNQTLQSIKVRNRIRVN